MLNITEGLSQKKKKKVELHSDKREGDVNALPAILTAGSKRKLIS